ncbi:helix-turn-helix domain-containing protein [Streptomyces sp. NPDC056224]|uniref:helix-turn-helix domain-containing protein n=1 Tax=Streptomyces sp. NPDC056224 TaxID=3345750 RepID=UPI0035DA034D
MPKPLILELTPDQKSDVEGLLLLLRDLPRNTRMRAECVRLSGQGRTALEVAGIMVVHPVTVRRALHRFTAGGTAALADAPRCGRPPKVTRADLDAMEEMLDAAAEDGGPTWTLPRLAAWLQRERGVEIHPARLSVLLKQDGFRYKRTRTTVRHKADEALQQIAKDQLEGLRLYG